MSEWDREVDVLVAGSGAAGFVAALTAKAEGLDVLLVEKAAVVGGSTAFSGGGAWIPNHPVLVRQQQTHSRESVLAYLDAIAGGRVERSRLERYADEGPKMAAFLETQSRHLADGFMWTRGYSDYHPDFPGGDAQGRGIWPKPIDLRELGDDASLIRGATLTHGGPLPPGAWMTSQDLWDVIRLRWKGGLTTGTRAIGRLGVRILRYRITGERMATSGRALVARLLLAAREQGVPIQVKTKLEALVTDDAGNVIGAELSVDGRKERIHARRGVVIATGGFDHSEELRGEHHPDVDHRWSFGSPDNLGDGHRIGAEVGAALDLMDDAWWMPAMNLGRGFFPLVAERQAPGQFIVNQAGERFVNESAPYTDFGHAQLEGQRTGVGHIPAYQISDRRALKRNFIAGKPPWKEPTDWIAAGVVHTAPTIEELATKIGVPPEALKATQERFNELARKGVDEDFGRGNTAYDNYYGDPSYPNPNLAPVDQPPYYAFEIVPGDLGTKGGLLTDADGRVLRADGSPIGGLYASGNASASVMGNDYAGPGATIGPAMTFAYVAARHMAAGSR